MNNSALKKIEFKYKSGDLLLILLLISSIKFTVMGKFEFSIYCVLLMTWHEIYRKNRN